MANSFKREIIISASVIIGSILIMSVALYFLAKDIDSQAEKVAAARFAISDKALALEALANLKNGVPKADLYKQAMDKILVSRDQLIDFPRWLDGLARSRQVAFTSSFQGNQVEPQGGLPAYVGFMMDAGGSLNNLIGFFKDVETQAPRFLVNFERFDLNGGGSEYKIAAYGKVFFKD
ncbi:MAG: hypothetical protein AAB655_01055 [Patescibacteria group bacterium]